MTKKFIFISLLLTLVIAPATAWAIVYAQYKSDPAEKLPDEHVQVASKEELLKAITEHPKHEHGEDDSGDELRILSIDSYKNINMWWYIINVRYATYGKEGSGTRPMIVVKYHNGADSIKIVTNPGEPLDYHNISDSAGIPYEIIDQYNSTLSKIDTGQGED